MSTKLQLPVILEKVSTLRDSSIRMVFDSQELNANDAALLFSMRKKIGWLLFSENESSEDEIPKNDVRIVGRKTLSQRLRAVIFLNWRQDKENKLSFEDYYNVTMESLIDNFKSNLISDF